MGERWAPEQEQSGHRRKGALRTSVPPHRDLEVAEASKHVCVPGMDLSTGRSRELESQQELRHPQSLSFPVAHFSDHLWISFIHTASWLPRACASSLMSCATGAGQTLGLEPHLCSDNALALLSEPAFPELCPGDDIAAPEVVGRIVRVESLE